MRGGKVLRRGLPMLILAMLLAGCGENWGSDQGGRPVDGADLRGRWLVINYWAQWCGPCRTEVPELNQLAESRPDVAVLGVNFDGLQGPELAAAAEALGIRFRVLATDPAERLGLPAREGLPVTYLIDDAGQFREQLLGEQTAQGLSERLAQLQRR